MSDDTIYLTVFLVTLITVIVALVTLRLMKRKKRPVVEFVSEDLETGELCSEPVAIRSSSFDEFDDESPDWEEDALEDYQGYDYYTEKEEPELDDEEKTQPDIFVRGAFNEAEPPSMKSPDPKSVRSFDTGGYPPSGSSVSETKSSFSWESSGGGSSSDYSSGSSSSYGGSCGSDD